MPRLAVTLPELTNCQVLSPMPVSAGCGVCALPSGVALSSNMPIRQATAWNFGNGFIVRYRTIKRAPRSIAHGIVTSVIKVQLLEILQRDLAVSVQCVGFDSGDAANRRKYLPSSKSRS